jgi:undecaprenyl-diphosphatase
MDTAQAAALAVLQGLTEFLPISSSAHLILLPLAVDWPDQGLAFDVAVHVGTLVAVVTYFAADLGRMARDWVRSLGARRAVGESRLAWCIIVATVPTGLAGLAVKALAGDALRSALVIAVANLVFAGALWWSDSHGRRRRGLEDLRLRDAVLVGCAQALALIPGASRSGVTMTAGLMLGLGREAAARFSFLLAVPVIALAGLVQGAEALSGRVVVDPVAFALGTGLSALCAFACIHAFLRLVERVGMLPFVIYRLALGAGLLLLVA